MYRFLILHYIGQYLLLSLIMPLGKYIYFSDFPIYQRVGPTTVKSNIESKFNSLSSPFIITHFSDTHVNSFNPRYGHNFEMSLNQSLLYQPSVFIHTGDLVDNFCTDTRPKYGHQCPNDYKEYKKIFQKYRQSFQYSFVVAGNHDMFGVYSFDSPNFNFLNTCKKLFDTPMKNYEEFLVSNYKVRLDDNFLINFVSLNPFTFPTAHPVMMYFAHTWKGFLDRLESIVDNIPENEKIIFYSHYPQSSFTSITNPIISRKSTTGKTIKDLIEKPNTIAFISGHNHPKKHLLEHHGSIQTNGQISSENCQYLETIGFDVKIQNKFEVITIDNERIVYHPIDSTNPPKCLITYPVPINQTTARARIADEGSLLRILCFNDRPLKIDIHGDIEGKTITNIKKIKEKVYLYEYPLKKIFESDRPNKDTKSFTKHHLSFDGDWEGEIDFYSDGIIPQFKEPKNHEYSRVYVARVSLFVIFIYLLFVTFPYTPTYLRKEEQHYFDFLLHSQNQTESLKNWFLTISGLCLRLKFQRINNVFHSILFIAVLWPIILPLSLMETEGNYGFIWAYGYYCNRVFRFSEHGQDYALYYYISVVFPLVLAGSSLAANVPLVGFGGLEAFCLFLFSFHFVSSFLWYYKLVESAGPFCMYISVYTVGLAALFPLLAFFYAELYMKTRNGRNTEWYSEGLTLVRSIPI